MDGAGTAATRCEGSALHPTSGFPSLHNNSPGERSPRHGVRVNWLGTAEFCPTVRRTKAIVPHLERAWRADTEWMLRAFSSETRLRALSYMYFRETSASWRIEREVSDADRTERFVHMLRQAHVTDFPSSDRFWVTWCG